MVSDDRIRKMIWAILDEVQSEDYDLYNFLWDTDWWNTSERKQYMQNLVDIAKMHLQRST